MPGMKFSCNLCGPWVRFHPRRYSRPSASYGRGLRAGSFRDQHPAYQPDLPSVCPCTAVFQLRHGAGEDIPGCVACRRPDLPPPRNSSSNCPFRGRHNHRRSTFNRRSAPQPTAATRGYRHVRPANCGPGRVAVGEEEKKDRRTEMRPKNLWDPSAHIRYRADPPAMGLNLPSSVDLRGLPFPALLALRGAPALRRPPSHISRYDRKG